MAFLNDFGSFLIGDLKNKRAREQIATGAQNVAEFVQPGAAGSGPIAGAGHVPAIQQGEIARFALTNRPAALASVMLQQPGFEEMAIEGLQTSLQEQIRLKQQDDQFQREESRLGTEAFGRRTDANFWKGQEFSIKEADLAQRTEANVLNNALTEARITKTTQDTVNGMQTFERAKEAHRRLPAAIQEKNMAWGALEESAKQLLLDIKPEYATDALFRWKGDLEQVNDAKFADTPAELDRESFRARQKNIQSLIALARLGTTTTAAQEQKIETFLPQSTDGPELSRRRIEDLIKWVGEEQDFRKTELRDLGYLSDPTPVQQQSPLGFTDRGTPIPEGGKFIPPPPGFQTIGQGPG